MFAPRRAFALPFALALVSIALAGCVTPDVEDALETPAPVVGDLLAGKTPLWNNPHHFPHPAFGFATLTHPPENVTLPHWWKPIPANPMPQPITGMAHHASAADTVPTGRGMSLFGSLAIEPGNPTSIVDISNPAAPTVLGTIDVSTRGSDTIAYPDGRLVTVLATSSGFLIYDITDPTVPKELGGVEPTNGGHKVDVVPGTPIVYNANSDGGGAESNLDPSQGTGLTEIYDLSNPDEPKHVQDFKNGFGCHRIYFYIDAAREYYRAICAGLHYTQLWDIKDPLNPEIVVNIPVHHGNPTLPSTAVVPASFSHFAILSDDAKVLIVGDETGGGAAPACDVYVDTPVRSVSGPLGNLYFYDMSDEKNPKLMSWLSPSHHYPSNPPGPQNLPPNGFPAGCTAHHGRLVPDADRDLLAMAFYGAGVVLVDFTDVSHPFIADQWNGDAENGGANVWEVWYYNGYLFTGDIARGLDALTFE